MRKRQRLLCVIFWVVCLPVFLFGQTNTENFAQLEFNFNNPGARAAGMGGAFISIADDATAAETNPAGMTTLLTPEVSFELKRINYTRNIFNFSSTGTRTDFELVDRDFEDWVLSPTFASVVYPFNNSDITVSVFLHELVNFRSTYFTQAAFVPGFTDGTAYFSVDNETEVKVANWGASAGYRINDRFSIGLAAGISQLDFFSHIVRNNQSTNMAEIDDNAQDFFLNVGLIYRVNDKLVMGGTFKRRPKFGVEYTGFNFTKNRSETLDINFNVPSATGIGLSYRATDFLTFAMDLVRIQYSQLTDDFVTTVNDGLEPTDFEAQDGLEIHFGGEYVGWFQEIGYVLRAGFYTDPNSSIEFVGNPNSGPANARIDRRILNTLFTEGETDTHITFGLGLLLNPNLQFDFAADLSEGSDEFVGSLVYRL